MSTSSVQSVPLIPIGQMCQRSVIFYVELKKGQALSQMFTNFDIIKGLVFEHMNVEPVAIKKLDMRVTLLVFLEDVDVKRICTTLQLAEVWLGHSVAVIFDISTKAAVLGWVIKAGGEKWGHILGRWKHTTT